MKAIPLPGLPGSSEFMAAYEAALAGVSEQRADSGLSRTSPGSVNALVGAYYASSAWATLSADTQKARRRIVEKFREQHGTKRVALLQRGTPDVCCHGGGKAALEIRAQQRLRQMGH